MTPRQRWNKRYAVDSANWLSHKPSQLLLDFVHLLPATGLALDAAAGAGQHGLYLAQRGWQVVALDISEVGLRLARERAAEVGVELATAVLDLSHLWLPPNHFDVILNFRFLERATFPVYQQALKPGGWLFFEALLKTGQETQHPQYYLESGELQTAFASLEQHHSYIYETRSGKVIEQLVARSM